MSSRSARAVDVAEHRPGFLVVLADEGGAYVGGLMVTDPSGLPMDFRYTDPVTPTRLQRALYGGVLDRYLRAEVVLRTLFAALDEPPTLIVVDDPSLLDEPIDLCPLALLGPSQAEPLGAVGTRSGEGSRSFLLQASAAGHPVRVTLPAAAGDEAMVVEAVVSLAARMDVLEPTERVRDALAVIIAEGVGP